MNGAGPILQERLIERYNLSLEIPSDFTPVYSYHAEDLSSAEQSTTPTSPVAQIGAIQPTVRNNWLVDWWNE
jgi:hypothetical protein